MPETGAFGQQISDSFIALNQSLTDYRNDRTEERARALGKAAEIHLRTRPRRSEVCPALGMLHALGRRGCYKMWIIDLLVGILRLHPQLWGIPGWNDFEMAAWMVDHDPFYTARIYKRLYFTKGIVNTTCAWMVNSMRQQDPEFCAQWSEVNTGFPPA